MTCKSTAMQSMCAICLDDINEDESVGLLFVCRHFFHFGCILPWAKKHLNCPTCRKEVPLLGGLHQCPLNMAKFMWERRCEEGQGNKEMSPREVRQAYMIANKEFFDNRLPPLGRSIVRKDFREPSINVRQDGTLVIRMPTTKTFVEQKAMLFQLMAEYLNLSPVIISVVKK